MLALPLPTPLRVRATPRFAGRGVTVAFLDSGFYPHADLTRPRNRILAHIDATRPVPVERKRFATPRVSSWHGLMTSCVAAGNGYTSTRTPGRLAPVGFDFVYRGPADQANLVLVKTGNVRGRRIGEAAIGRALRWVIDNQQAYGIRIVNISLGGDHVSDGRASELEELVDLASRRGLLVVAAIGNDGAHQVRPPASATGAIAVGGLLDHNSTDPERWQLWHSNYGPGEAGLRKPDLIAPAEYLAAPMLPRTHTHNEALFLWRLVRASDPELEALMQTDFAMARISRATARLPLDELRWVIWSRMRDEKFVHPHYQHVDGTSMAAPIVSAVLAQMLEANPALQPRDAREILLGTAERLPRVAAERQGAGVVRADKAVAAARSRRREDIW